jgi:RND superfamily putative drug exporter
MYDQMDVMTQNSAALGQAFDAANNDDSFYAPPEVFDNPDFKRRIDKFISPDGHAARFIISHRGDPATPEGIARVDPIKNATEEAIKGTPLERAKIHLGGSAAASKDMRDGSAYDLIIAAISAVTLILIIMLIITRSLVSAITIVGTVLLPLGASLGLSVLLLVSRFKEEIHAGIKTGTIRSMAGTGAVVTKAGLVFAATMASFIFSDLGIIGQAGTTIGLGLLFDTLIVRSFMMPSIAPLLGRWSWWPTPVRIRPTTPIRRSSGPRPSKSAAPPLPLPLHQ